MEAFGSQLISRINRGTKKKQMITFFTVVVKDCQLDDVKRLEYCPPSEIRRLSSTASSSQIFFPLKNI